MVAAGNEAWYAPTGKTSNWVAPTKDRHAKWGDYTDEYKRQRAYDEAELRGGRVERSWWGREKKFDGAGRELKNPEAGRRNWW